MKGNFRRNFKIQNKKENKNPRLLWLKVKQDRINIAPFLSVMTDEDTWLNSIPRKGLKSLLPIQPGYFAKINHKTPIPKHTHTLYKLI